MNAIVKIDSKAIEKLIELVGDVFGNIYSPFKIRKEADAQAYAIKVIEKAKAEAAVEKRLIEIESEERIARRIAAKEVRRQENIDYIVERAAQNLLEEDSVSEKAVDVDWAARFFDYAQDISMEEMKDLWARILAKEVQKPSSFSLRTLDVLRNISVEEARTFEKVAQFVLFEQECFILNKQDVLDSFNISFDDIVSLRECGILQSADFIVKSYRSDPKEESTAKVYYGDYLIKIVFPPNSGHLDFPIVLLTKVGQELLSLIDVRGQFDYLTAVAKTIKQISPRVSLHYSEWQIVDGIIKTTKPFLEL